MLSYATGGVTMLLMLLGIFLFFLVGVGQRLFPQFSDAVVMKLPYLKDLVFTRDNFISLYRFSLMVKAGVSLRSEEHTSELQSLMRISYAVFCLKKKKTTTTDLYKLYYLT